MQRLLSLKLYVIHRSKNHSDALRRNEQYVDLHRCALLRYVRIMNTLRYALQTICSLSDEIAWRTMRIRIKTPLRSIFCTNIVKSKRNIRLVNFRDHVSLFKVFALALTFAVSPQTAAAESRLIMVTSDHCPSCQAWELDVGRVYDKSPYSTILPLTRVEIGSKMPGSVTFQKPVVGTPSFLIIHNGQEIGRQNGYFDAEMFWWWLSEYAAK